MNDLITEIYRAHQKRQSELLNTINDLQDELEENKKELAEFIEWKDYADDLAQQLKDERAIKKGRKTSDQIKQEKKIKSIRANYPTIKLNSLKTKVKNLKEKIEKTKKNYSVYDKEDIDLFDIDDSDDTDPSTPEERTFDPEIEAIYDINTLSILQWIPWPDEYELPKFEASKKGVGPGEERLAVVLAAEVQGGTVSYDLLTPDGARWEVKGLELPSSLIRPAVEGREAFHESRIMILQALDQMKSFTENADETVLDQMDERSVKIVEMTKSFVKKYYNKITKRNEVSADTIDKLAKMLSLLSEIKQKYGDQDEGEISVTFADRIKYNVSRKKFFDIADVLKKEDPNILKIFDNFTVAMTYLSDEVFINPDEFLQKIEDNLNIDDVFTQVDGLIIVNSEKGFNIIPKSEFNETLEWALISTGEPRLRFLRF